MSDANTTNPQKLVRAAKLALNLLEMARETLWNLYPEELLALTQDDENSLAASMAKGLGESYDPAVDKSS